MEKLSHWVKCLNYIFNPTFVHIVPEFGLKPKYSYHFKLVFSIFSSNKQECYMRPDSTEIHDVFDLTRTRMLFSFYSTDCRSDIKEPSPQRDQHTPFESTNHTEHNTKHNSQER